jgi:nuclear GTP-binding protein
VVANADVVIEVLDARDPASCRSNELEKEILAAGKKLVLLLNKIDLVPRHAVEAWKKYLQRSFPTITFKAARSGARRPVHAMTSAENAPEGLLRSTHGVVGADELMQLLKNYCRMNGSKTKAHVSVGIVGYPNTGKSSIINSMKRQCSVQVGGKAGVTKQLQEIPLDKKLTLIDSPGVVFAGHADDPSTVLRNVVSVESISDPVGVVEALIAKTPREALLEFYGADHNFSTAWEFLTYIAQSRGKLVKGSALDIHSAAKSVIQDWTTGRFRYFTMPPVSEDTATSAQAETTEFVQQLAPALDIDALFNSSDDAMDSSSLPQPLVLAAPQQGGNGDDSMDCDGVSSGMIQVDM